MGNFAAEFLLERSLVLPPTTTILQEDKTLLNLSHSKVPAYLHRYLICLLPALSDEHQAR